MGGSGDLWRRLRKVWSHEYQDFHSHTSWAQPIPTFVVVEGLVVVEGSPDLAGKQSGQISEPQVH